MTPLPAGARDYTSGGGFRTERSVLSPASCLPSQPGEMEPPLDPVIKGLCLLVLLSLLPLSCHLAGQLTTHMFIHSLNRPFLWAIIPWEPGAQQDRKKGSYRPPCSVCINPYIFRGGRYQKRINGICAQ